MEKITKTRFMNYEKTRKSGRMNMMAYGDMKVLTNYDKLYEHFIELGKEEDITVD